MDRLRNPPPARLFFGVFTGFEELFDWVERRLAKEFGPLDESSRSPIFPFPTTRTYSRTMGDSLQRRFFFLAAGISLDCLANVKHRTLEIEAEARQLKEWPVERAINIDPGLLNDCRIILSSTKDYAHRIYRDRGIWEEITLVYRNGRYEALPWTYPDFRAPTYHPYFADLRRKYLASLQGS